MKVDRERIDAFLKKIKAPVCPLCGNSNWTVSDTVFQAIEFDFKGILVNGASMPIVAVTCTECGNTHMVNALVAGIIEKEAQDEKGTESTVEEESLKK